MIDKLSWNIPDLPTTPSEFVGWLVEGRSRYAVIKRIQENYGVGHMRLKGNFGYWGRWADSEEEAIRRFNEHPEFKPASATGGFDTVKIFSPSEIPEPIRKILL